MKPFLRKFKVTFIRGLIIFIPLVFLAFLITVLFGFLEPLVAPIASILPSGGIFGLGMTKLTALVIIFLIILLLGYFAKSKRGLKMNEKFEAYVPGFRILKSALTGEMDELQACLVTLDDAWLFAVIVEEHESGMITVFIPAAPSPMSGSIYFMKEEQIKRLDVPSREAIKYLMQFGSGAKNLLDKKIKW